jgi:hypothetical protein
MFTFYHLGWDRHIEYVSVSNYENGMRHSLYSYILWGFSVSFIKLSVLLFYKHVTDPGYWHRRIWWLLFTVILLWTILYETLCPLVLDPNNGQVATILTASLFAVNLLTDVVVVVVPSGLIWRLNIAVRDRLILISFFFVALAASGIALAKTIYLVCDLFRDHDAPWDFYNTWMLSDAELYVGMVSHPIRSTFTSLYRRGKKPKCSFLRQICGSFPPLRPFITKYTLVVKRSINSSCRRSTVAPDSSNDMHSQVGQKESPSMERLSKPPAINYDFDHHEDEENPVFRTVETCKV